METIRGTSCFADSIAGSSHSSSSPLPDGPSLNDLSPNNVSLSDIVSALSFALDLTEAAIPGHAVRTCLLGMRIAEALRVSDEEKSSLYYALLLKDVGCSSYAARWSEIIGGDEHRAKQDVRLLDWTRLTWEGAVSMWKNVLPGKGAWTKLRRVIELAQQRKENLAEMVGLRSDRGAKIAGKIGLSAETAETIRHLDEHWNGGGYPDQLRGEHIPLGSRIASIAQNLDVFNTERGTHAAMEMISQRIGRWFDPRIVKIVESLHLRGQLWSCVDTGCDRDMVLALDPGHSGRATANQIDTVCEAFADVVDAKSAFTYKHSLGVTRAAIMIAAQLGLEPDRQKLVYRAALLHDIGKLRVPNSILDKPGKLDAEEWRIVREHPLLTQRILERVAKFDVIARTASQHHERLDGTGYPHGLNARDLSTEARVIAVADVYGALSEDRPYRPGLGMDEIMSIMGADVPEKLDAECFAALQRGLKSMTPLALPSSGRLSHGGERLSPAMAAKLATAPALVALAAAAPR